MCGVAVTGIWNGEGWLADPSDVAVLAAMFLIFTAISTKVFSLGVAVVRDQDT